MKKLLVALTAALGFAAASVPASAGGSISVSTGYYGTPTYGYNYVAPSYGYTVPAYGYNYGYVAPRYYVPTPSVSFTFGTGYYGNSYYRPYRKYRGHRHHRRHHRGGHRYNW